MLGKWSHKVMITLTPIEHIFNTHTIIINQQQDPRKK